MQAYPCRAYTIPDQRGTRPRQREILNYLIEFLTQLIDALAWVQ